MSAPLLSLQRALHKRPSGDRIMADVLACVPKFGLDAVLAAALRLLALGPISVEQVRHLITTLPEGRLHPTEAQTVATPEALQLKDVPMADTQRYDQLSPTFSITLGNEESDDAGY